MIDSTQRAAGEKRRSRNSGIVKTLRAHVERHQHPAEHQQAPGVQLVVGQRDAAGRARAGQADEVLGADVRREDRRADDEPAQAATGEEVVLRGVLVVVEHPPRQPGERREVGKDDQPVEGRHGAVAYLNWACGGRSLRL